MKDFISKGTGNSRFLKSISNFKSLYPTYDSFVAALVAGTLPIDFNGINADGITQVGTALNKQNLLTDATAELFGLTDEAVPEDAFAWLGKYNLHWWERRVNGLFPKVADESVSAVMSKGHRQEAEVTIKYSDEIVCNPDTGKFSLVNPSSVTITNDTRDDAKVMAGKYFIGWSDNAISSVETAYRVVPEPKVSASGLSTSWMLKITAQEVTAETVIGEWENLQSADSDAYPHEGVGDGFEYRYLGVPFENVVNPIKIEYGTYVGTSSKPASLTFSGTPLVVFLSVYVGANDYLVGVITPQGGIARGMDDSNTLNWVTFDATLSGKKLTWGSSIFHLYYKSGQWYNPASSISHYIFNSSSYTYHYCALTV